MIAAGFCSFFTGIGKKLQRTLPQLVNPIQRNHNHEKPEMSLNPNDKDGKDNG